ncbi:MAG: transglutaminase TgpA family protein [Actinomycetota bacterium]
MGSEARARLGLAGLLAATLFAFGQVFSQDVYAGPALLAMLLAAGIAIGCRRLGIGTVAAFGLSTLALIWYLALIFEGRAGFYGLPTPDALRGLWRSISEAYEAGRVDYAPVPMRPGYVVLAVGAMWLATTIAEVATFRWRRPLLASLPALALFGFLVVVGTGHASTLLMLLFLAALLTFWGLEASHRLRSWGRWMHALWRTKSIAEPESVAGSLARRMAASCVAAALISPLLLPTLNEGLLSWRNKVDGNGPGRGGAGGRPGGSIDLLVDIRPKLLRQSDLELFRVHADSPAYWRLTSLTLFDGQGWVPDSPALQELPNGQVVTFRTAPADAQTVNQEYVITGLDTSELPAAVQPISAQLAGDERSDDFRYNPENAALRLLGGTTEGFEYSVTSAVVDASFRELQRAEVGRLNPEYYALPELPPVVGNLARRWTAGARTDFAKLLALQDTLRDFTYSTDVDAPPTDDALVQFLTETRTGYCQQFATAFAVLARSLGYPTRVNVGFLPGSSSLESPDDFFVTGTDAHAWPEVYFEDFGWVRFEPTPRADAPVQVPTYTQPGLGTGSSNTLAAVREQDISLRFQDEPGGLRGARQGGDPGGLGARISTAWRKTFRRIATASLVALAGALVIVPLLKELRIRRRYRRAADPGGVARAAFRQLEDEASELASPREPWESAASYAERLVSIRRVGRRDARRLAALFEAAEYGPASIPAARTKEARALARSLRKDLWGRATWWERAVRLFSPRSLIPQLSSWRVPVPRLAGLLHRS